MVPRLSNEQLESHRKIFFEDDHSGIYQHTGFYLYWFAAAETSVTAALATILGFNDWHRLDVVTKGMDARVKAERMRQAAKQYRPLGPYLDAYLSYFERECVPRRNNLAHCWTIYDDSDKRIYFASFGKRTTDAINRKGPSVHLDDLFTEAMWLNSFAKALWDAVHALVQQPSTTLEIKGLNWNMPEAYRPKPDYKDHLSKPRKLPQTQNGKHRKE